MSMPPIDIWPIAKKRAKMCKFSVVYVETTQWDKPKTIASIPTYRPMINPDSVSLSPFTSELVGLKIIMTPNKIGTAPAIFRIVARLNIPSSSAIPCLSEHNQYSLSRTNTQGLTVIFLIESELTLCIFNRFRFFGGYRIHQ